MDGPGIEPRVALERELHQVLHLVGRVGPAASTGSVLKVALLSTGLALGALMTLCLCASVAAIAWGGFLVEQSQIQAVLHIALGLMRDGELEQAHALFATMAQSRALRADLERITSGLNGLLFDGYSSLTVDSANIGLESSQELTGLVARVAGTVTYEEGYFTSFDAVLVKEDNAWRLVSVNVSVPTVRWDEIMEARS
jgi:hypothetical protein